MISLSVLHDTATPALRALVARLRKPRELNRVMAKAVINRLKDHFAERGMEGNKRGWPSRKTWQAIRGSTGLASATNEGATISMGHPAIRQKFFGSEVLGPIRPKDGKRLALPATAQAYMAGWPRHGNTPTLKCMLAFNSGIQRWMLALVNAEDQAGMKQVKDRRKGHQGETRWVRDPKSPAGVWYWLARQVTVPRDPRALPSDDVLMSHATAAAQVFLAKEEPA
jgi:hypothetical protein